MDLNSKEVLYDITNIKNQETYTLPSKGLCYKDTDNIPASITLRRMTTKEDKIRLRNEAADKIRRDILQNCIVEPGIKADSLKLEDANFLLFRLRALSLLDDTYKIKCYCDKCSTTFIHQINLSEVPINYLNKEKMKLLKIELPLSKQKIDFKFPSLRDIINMSDRLKQYVDQFPNADKNEAIYTVTTIVYIDKVEGKHMASEQLEDWLDGLDIIDVRAVRNHISHIDGMFGLNTDLAGVCPKCNNEVKHGLPITSELFTPSL